LYRGLKRALDRPGADRAVIVIALVCLAFSLDTGLSGDDYVHKLVAQGSHSLQGFVRAPFDMYRFTDSAQTTRKLMREGVIEWWADPEARLSFFRPVSALSHYLDYRLWPGQPWLMHLHSLAWAALVFAGLLRLYRSLIAPPWVCALALFVYALDDARGWFVSWIAARNAVIATAFTIWALYFHRRARVEQYRPGLPLATGCFALGLLSGEGATSICGYLLGHAWFLERGPIVRRVLGLWPYGLVLLVWRAVYIALGYGVQHSGLYFDPSHEPWLFLRALVERGPMLMFSQLGGAWSDAWTVMFAFPTLQRTLVWIAVVYLIAFGYVLWPLVRRDPVMQFAVFGALFSLLPASATFIADRLLTWVAIGASLAIARLAASYIDEREALTSTALRGLLLPPLMAWLVFEKAVVDPLFLPSRARGNLVVRDSLDRAEAAVPTTPAIQKQRVIYLNPVAVPQAAYIAIERAGQNMRRPIAQSWLATGETEVSVERIDARTLKVRQRGGYLLSPGSRLFRNPARSFTRGTRVELDGITLVVSDLTEDGRPAEVVAEFDRPLEDPGYLWLQWGDVGYVPFVPPAIGSKAILPAADFIHAIFGTRVELPIDGRLPPPKDDHFGLDS
jgi:hypothetical protein